jgi:competence protein ComEC
LAGESAELQEWKKLIAKEEANIEIAQAGQIISEDNLIRKSIHFSVLYPFESLEEKTVKNTNDSSIIIKLISKDKSFLFCGDASKSVERELINNNIDIDSDILKISHHGSKNSTSEEFLKKVSPNLAIISVGEDNSYGHPSSEVLVLLEKYDIKFLRTDINGDIKIIN